MSSEESFRGESPRNFADAARIAVENAEEELRRRGVGEEELPREYEVTFRVTAHGPLGDYRAFVTPFGG